VYAPMALVPLLALGYTNYLAIGEWQPAYAKFGSVWYEYPGSHWYQPPDQPSKAGIDFADESKPVYAFHNTFGHHGIFSLTPIWLFAFVGMIGLSWQCRQNRTNLTLTGLMSFVASLIVIAFYVWKTNNYGGWTAGPRWFYWLTPLWLIAMLPMMDRLALTRWGRGLAMVALLVSVFSAGYPSGNPNRHPWLYQMTEYYGWMSYERR